MSRGGAMKDGAEPERRCIVTGEVGPKAGLVRFVASPEGVIVPDILEKLPGRGIWITADRALIEKAKAGQFARGAKGPVTVPPDLAGEVERQLARRVVDLIALARKSGRAVAGFEKVKAALEKGGVRVLLQASDGSLRGKDKLWTPTGARYYACLSADELGLAFGRQTVIHAALSSGALSDRVVEEAAKLRGLREMKTDTSSVRKEQTPDE